MYEFHSFEVGVKAEPFLLQFTFINSSSFVFVLLSLSHWINILTLMFIICITNYCRIFMLTEEQCLFSIQPTSQSVTYTEFVCESNASTSLYTIEPLLILRQLKMGHNLILHVSFQSDLPHCS